MSCNTIARGSFDSPTVATVNQNGSVQFVNTLSTCKDVTFNGGDVTISRPGTYLIIFNATLVATVAGPQEVQLFRNGNPVPGAHAIETAAAVGNNVSMAFATPLTVKCCNDVTISLRALTATSVRIANLTIVEVSE